MYLTILKNIKYKSRVVFKVFIAGLCEEIVNNGINDRQLR